MISCQVCGNGIGGEVAICATCSTPHHQDCWDFAGACSVYGCGSERASRYDFSAVDPAGMLVKISEHVALSLQAEDREAPPGERSRDIQDLFKYKRSLLRSLYSSLEKARPEGPDARLKALYDEVVDGGSRGADEEVFLARPLESNRSDEHAALDRKRALMRRMNEVSLVPETEISLIQQVQRLLMRLRSWFTGRR